MSSCLYDRLLLSSTNVKRRLETLLNLCRIYEHPSVKIDDPSEELYRFYGPDHSDIEELEESIISISSLIENLQHEQNSTDCSKPFPNYPLCKNGWTLKEIEEAEKEKPLQLDILNQLSLHLLMHHDVLEEQESATARRNVNIFVYFLNRRVKTIRIIRLLLRIRLYHFF